MGRTRRKEQDQRGGETAAQCLAAYAAALDPAALPEDVVEKAKLTLLDMLACALEARGLPWSRQALAVVGTGGGTAPIVAESGGASPAEAAFVNGTMAHGLIREDMHPTSISHLGVVVWPTLLALLTRGKARGGDLVAAAVAGYEAGARIGRTLFDKDLARRVRPTGVTGPIGAAAAGARLLRLDAERTTAAIALAANTGSGLNNWPWAGSTEVFFHAGIAARNAVTAALLAEAGLHASASVLDGEGGLYDAHGRGERAAGIADGLGDGFEIRGVYFKPAPACNYVQTACQAALDLAGSGVRAGDVAAVSVATFSAATGYPGCDYAGPFDRLVQAKMSIQFSVAATLARGALEEAIFARLDDPEILRLAEATTLTIDPAFEAAFPGRQGAEVAVRLKDGTCRRRRRDDVGACPPDGVRERFRAAASAVLGAGRAAEIAGFVDALERAPDARELARLVAR
jgi:2-methylcitrate dehydratase PrpD